MVNQKSNQRARNKSNSKAIHSNKIGIGGAMILCNYALCSHSTTAGRPALNPIGCYRLIHTVIISEALMKGPQYDFSIVTHKTTIV